MAVVKFDITDQGWVVVPLNAAGSPIGIALYCATAEDCELVFNQEGGAKNSAYLLSLWRSSESVSAD